MIGWTSIIGGPLGLARIGAGLGLGVVLFWAYDTFIDDPHIRELAKLQCVIDTQEDAQKAEDAVRELLRKADEAAQEAYERDLQKSTERYSQTISDLRQEIADYDAQLAGEGRLCPLTDADFVRLRGGLPP